MNYVFVLFLCFLMMGVISATMFYLGRKISYNYILYNASITFGSGVIFFIVKMILTTEEAGKIEQIVDIVMTMFLIIVFFVSLVETLVIEVMENGKEIKRNLQSFANKIRTLDGETIKTIPVKFNHIQNKIVLKWKSQLPQTIEQIKKLKLVFGLMKKRIVNKKV